MAGPFSATDSKAPAGAYDVAAQPEGHFVVVWEEGDTIWGRRFNRAWGPVEQPFPIAPDSQSEQGAPQVHLSSKGVAARPLRERRRHDGILLSLSAAIGSAGRA